MGGEQPGHRRGAAGLGEVAVLDQVGVEPGDGERVLEAAQPRHADVGVECAGNGGYPAAPDADEVLGGEAGAAAVVRVHVPGGFGVQRTSAVDDGQVELPGEAVERIVAVQPHEHDAVGPPGTQNALEPGAAEVGVGQRQHQHQIGALERGADAGDDLRVERVREQLRVVVRDGEHDRSGLLGGQGPGGGVGHVAQFPHRPLNRLPGGPARMPGPVDRPGCRGARDPGQPRDLIERRAALGRCRHRVPGFRFALGPEHAY